jgi:hypothetical protein
VAITSPANGATVAGSVPIHTADTCAGKWFESVYVDGRYVTDADTGAVAFNSLKVGNGSHVIKITSQSMNPGSQVLGSAQVTLNVQNAPAPSPAPSPAPAPAPPPSPGSGSGCVTITSPANGATVSGSVPIRTTDTCAGNWFETLYVDGRYVTDEDTGSIVFNSLRVGAGNHVIKVTSQSMNPGSRVLGSAQVTLNVQNLSLAASAQPKIVLRAAPRGSWTVSAPTIDSTTPTPTPSGPNDSSPTLLSSTSAGGASSPGGDGGNRNTYVLLVLGAACVLLSSLGGALFVGWRRSRLI